MARPVARPAADVAPNTPAAASPTQEHVVRSGDTLSGIAQHHKVPLGDLLKANPQFDPNSVGSGIDFQRQAPGTWDADAIFPGDRIQLPRAAAAPASPIEQKAQATDSALRALHQTQNTYGEIAIASQGQSTALPHLRESVAAAQRDFDTAYQTEVNARASGGAGERATPDAAGYAAARDAIAQRHQNDPASTARLQEAAKQDVAARQSPSPDTNAPVTPEDLAQQFPDEMQGRSEQEQQEAADAATQLQNGSPEEKVQALGTLSLYLSDASMDRLSRTLNVDGDATVKSLLHDQKARDDLRKLADPASSDAERAAAGIALAEKLNSSGMLPQQVRDTLKPLIGAADTVSKAVNAAITLTDPDASAADKAQATLDVMESVAKFPQDSWSSILKPLENSVKSGKALVAAIEAWANPDASALDKAQATLKLATALKTSLGDISGDLKTHLRFADSSLATIGHALTLLDPDASVQDRAEAAIGLLADAPQVAGDVKALTEFLRGNGVGNATEVAQDVAERLNRSGLPPSLLGKLDGELAAQLTPDQVTSLNQLHGRLGDELGDTLAKLRDPAAVDELIKALDGVPDEKAAKGLLQTLRGMKPGQADELLVSPINGKPASQALADIFSKLDDASARKLADMVGATDLKGARLAMEMADFADGDLLKQVLRQIPDGKQAGQVLGALATMLDSSGMRMTAKLAPTILNGLLKAIPVAGAVPAAIDVVRMGEIAGNPNLPPDIRYLALQAAKLNTVDAVWSVAEPFTALAFGAGVAIDVVLAAAGIGMDLLITDQLEKYEQAQANGEPYEAPAWLQMANVGIAAAQGPQGAMELALIYGPEGATELVGSVARMGGDAAIAAVEMQQTLLAQGVGEGMQLTAEGLHTLADIIRDPAKYGAAAQQMVSNALDTLGEVARGAGELAEAARQQLGAVVDELQRMGMEGVQTLQWIASHPGEAAELAANALSSLVQEGLRIGGETGQQLVQSATQALTVAGELLAAGGEAAKAALDAVNGALQQAVDNLVAAGQQGLETLVWIANNPGQAADMAKDALLDVMAKGGELAEQAWNQVVALGEQGVQLATDVAHRLQDLGEAGVALLKYVVENPGEAADAVRQAALDTLENLARGVGDVAQAATQALTDFVDSGIEQARQTVEHLLTEGGAAAERIIETWSNELSAGAQAIIDGLKDVGDAGREALGKLADAGITVAQDVVRNLAEAGGEFSDWAQDQWDGFMRGLPWVPER
ncbi:MAG: LysM peptidoglycan-binding domain-containing protein [Pseudomonadota bacterium]|nr:LysM peptidoglycan-binding domain-containing protein [Pseudomonadota bacterium]